MTPRTAFFSLCAMNALWGGTYSLTKWVLLFLPPATLAVVRFFLSGLMLFAVYPPDWKDFSREDWKDLFLTGFLGISLAFMLHYWGIRMTTATKTSIAIALEPVLILLLSVIILKEKMESKVLLALACSFLGAVFLVAGGKNLEQLKLELFNGGEVAGDILVILSVVLGSFYTILCKPLVKRIGPIPTTAFGFIIGAVILVPFSLLEFQQGSVIICTVRVALAVGFISLVCTAFGYVLWNQCLTEVPASVLGITLYIQPVAGVAVGILFFGESLKILDMIGAVFILLGVSLAPTRD